MSDLLQRVAHSVERRGLLTKAGRLGVAVSGGADSVCLLYVLVDLAAQWGRQLHVLHLNHGLRGEESRGDAEFVRGLADSLGLPSTIRDVDLKSEPGNLEQAARRARLAFFQEMIQTGLVDLVAVGHTRSDQAETVLFRFLRGAGTAGLAGIRPETSGGIIRPLIDVDRPAVERFLRERKIPWREDSTNTSIRFARNRIRHQLLPQLEREWNPAIIDTLAQTADWALAEEAWWEAEIDRLSVCLIERNGAVLVRSDAINALPAAVSRRLIRRAIQRAKGDLRQIDFRHVEVVLEMAAVGRGHGRAQLPGLDVVRSFDWLRFGIFPVTQIQYSMAVNVPGIMRVSAAQVAFHMELIEKWETFEPGDGVYNNGVGCLDWLRLSGSLALRNWRPGDEYQPWNGAGIQKIKTLFQKTRIPVWERPGWPILTDGNAIIWARRFGPAAGLAAGAQTGKILRIREMPPE